jgi:hypothetical protein
LFDILEENDVKLSKDHFYVIRSGKEIEFVAWLKEKVKSLEYFKSPQLSKYNLKVH